MKQMKINPTPTKVKPFIRNVSPNKYYGLRCYCGGFITREQYKDGKYVTRSLSGVTVGNGWPNFDADTLEECIINILGNKMIEVYEFETQLALFKWLATGGTAIPIEGVKIELQYPPQEPDESDLDGVADDKYYGIQSRWSGRGYITRTNYETGAFTGRCLDNVTVANGWSFATAETLRNCIKNFLEHGAFEIYEFTSKREFISWLTEGETE